MNNMIWHIVSVRLPLDPGLLIIGIHLDNWTIKKGIDRHVFSTCQTAHRHLLEKDRKAYYNSMV